MKYTRRKRRFVRNLMNGTQKKVEDLEFLSLTTISNALDEMPYMILLYRKAIDNKVLLSDVIDDYLKEDEKMQNM